MSEPMVYEFAFGEEECCAYATLRDTFVPASFLGGADARVRPL